jgi:hypothetical protein
MAKGTCSVEGCERSGPLVRGWCGLHYQRWYRQGDPTVTLVTTDHADLCAETGCDRPYQARGWCELHYRRWLHQGDPQKVLLAMGAPVETRFWAKVNKDGPVPVGRPELGPCWLWTASVFEAGYGQFVISHHPRRSVTAHNFAYRQLVGEIPVGLELDHLCHHPDSGCGGGVTCRHRRCCNPSHLEPVTNAENVRRGMNPSSRNRRKTHCIRSHPFNEANTGRTKNGGRWCRTCRREYGRERYIAAQLALGLVVQIRPTRRLPPPADSDWGTR